MQRAFVTIASILSQIFWSELLAPEVYLIESQ